MKIINKNILNKFLLISVPILLLWFGMLTLGMIEERDYVIKYAINQNQMQDENTSKLINRYLEEIAENLKVVRDSDEVKQYMLHESEDTKKSMTDMFVRIMSNKDHYDQIRFIDTEGLEVVRIDNDGSITIVNELQRKCDRYYFQETIGLSDNEIYISPLDLNIENGEIELPIKPMIRIGTPLYDSQHNRAGIIIINYRADFFLNLLMKHEGHEEFRDDDLYVLNRQGQYIIHPDPSQNFSFMYDEKKGQGFDLKYKNLWQQMESHDHVGSLIEGNRLTTYYNVLDAAEQNDLVSDDKWIVVHMMDTSNQLALETIVKTLFLSSNGIISLIMVCIIYIIALAMDRLKDRDLELDITKEIATSTNDAIIITDAETNITYVNEMYEKYTGYKSSEVLGLTPSRFKSGKHGRDFYKSMWDSIHNEGHWQGTLWDKKKNGMLYPKNLKIIAIRDKKSNRAHHYIGIFSDASIDYKANNHYEILNYSDGQMLIPNEKIMLELLQESIKTEKFSFMILYISIENYSQLVSIFEHEDVDLVKTFMDLANPFIKQDDLIAQTGKNLFAIIIGMHNVDGHPTDYVSNLHRNLNKVINVNGKDVFFKSKLGVSYWPQDTDDIRKLLLNSMIALEWTTKRGESEISYYEDYMIEELNQESEIESYLKTAIEKDELYMVYQPQIDIQTNEIVGMEALLRWHNDILGYVSPAVFIPIAENNYLMTDLGDWIIHKVCEDLNWMGQDPIFKGRQLRCAINLSAVQIENVQFYDKLMACLNQYKIVPSQLEMEITESSVLSDKKNNIKVIEQIRTSGMTVAIDDFGTGYSSLSYLNTLPVDKIKIDRSFIKNYPHSDDGRLISILVEMSKKMGMKVLTEGAETYEQANFLREMGCNYIQGYYYSKPLEKNEFMSYVKDYK